MPNHKLIEGFIKYLKRAEDPNYRESIETHGIYAIFEAFEAWENETPPSDHKSIPETEILVELHKYMQIAPA